MLHVSIQLEILHVHAIVDTKAMEMFVMVRLRVFHIFTFFDFQKPRGLSRWGFG